MKFSLNWLREFVELPNDTAQLSELLTLAGVEIEGIETRGANFAHVVVAQTTASAPHPNADRLTVCQVDDGSGQTRQIVCGAKNYKVGDKVPLALPGAILPNDFAIMASKLRGPGSENSSTVDIVQASLQRSRGNRRRETAGRSVCRSALRVSSRARSNAVPVDEVLAAVTAACKSPPPRRARRRPTGNPNN